jgi:hypothetical protein
VLIILGPRAWSYFDASIKYRVGCEFEGSPLPIYDWHFYKAEADENAMVFDGRSAVTARGLLVSRF